MLEVLYVQLEKIEGQLPFNGAEQQKVYGHHGNYYGLFQKVSSHQVTIYLVGIC
jgi:hypothetical protein